MCSLNGAVDLDVPSVSSIKHLQVGVGATVCALILSMGTPAAQAQVVGSINGALPIIQYARGVEQREEHVHADVDGVVTIPITTLYSVSTPIVTETSSEEPECSASIITKFVTVTQEAKTIIEPESSFDSIEYSTVTEVHTAVSTIVKTLTNSAAVTVIETPIEEASGKDGISYPPPPAATPVTTTTTWSTVTSGEPVTSTSFVVVTEHSPATTPGGINATVIIYPPGGDPQPIPSDSPIIVGAASEPQRGSHGIVFAAVAAIGAIMCLF